MSSLVSVHRLSAIFSRNVCLNSDYEEISSWTGICIGFIGVGELLLVGVKDAHRHTMGGHTAILSWTNNHQLEIKHTHTHTRAHTHTCIHVHMYVHVCKYTCVLVLDSL